MSATKTKRKVTYELQLGNTEERSGHRRDCAQISATIRVAYGKDEEHSPELALQFVKDELDSHPLKVTETYEGVSIEFTLNASRATVRDVKEV
jgi:hypothetical protein